MGVIDIMQFIMLGALAYFVGRAQVKLCSCPICQHAKTLSDEAIKDIVKEALPETSE